DNPSASAMRQTVGETLSAPFSANGLHVRSKRWGASSSPALGSALPRSACTRRIPSNAGSGPVVHSVTKHSPSRWPRRSGGTIIVRAHYGAFERPRHACRVLLLPPRRSSTLRLDRARAGSYPVPAFSLLDE